ncbi:MAG: S8 family serine peptidase [Phycisphaerales bacterium]|nr:S8 family serine peptidase [Phycisphaerales bacterium]
MWLHRCAGLALLIACLPASAQVVSDAAALAAYREDKRALEQNPALEFIPGSVLVRFDVKTPEAALAQALSDSRAQLVRTYSLVPGLVHVRTALPVDRAIDALRASPWVEYAEPDYVQRTTATTPNDTYFGLQWGLHNTGQDIRGVLGVPDADIDMPEAWDITTGQSGFVVAVIDTGTQWSHPDLDANIWSNPGEIAGNGIDDDGNGYVDDIRGWDFYSDDNNPDDGDGHGTHTAGTVGAEGNNGIGVAGVNWQCRIMPLRFIGPFGGSTADAIAALDYAAAKGVKVSNNSWGGGGYSSSMYNAINASKSVGHVFVAAAGNAGTNNDSSPFYPASYNLDNIVSVAATDNRDALAGFSNYGATSVDLGAPGVDIASTYSGNSYAWSSGTSMAAPHVAGVVALVYQQNPGFTYSQVIGRVLSTARPVSALANRCATGGVLNAFAALAGGGGGGNTAPSVTITSPADNSTFTEGASVTFTGSASDAQDGDLSGSITWTSNLDGAIGAGASFATSTLSVGTHVVTASVTDSGGLVGSDTVTVIIDPAPGTIPNPPSDVVAINNKNRTATVSWSDNSDNETSFQIERQKQNKKGNWTSSTYFTAGANATSYTDNSGTGTFRYRVRARNSAGDSAWSDWAEVTVTRK